MRRLAGEPGRDTKSVQREVAMLTATGPIDRRAADKVAVGWDRAVTELDLAGWGWALRIRWTVTVISLSP